MNVHANRGIHANGMKRDLLIVTALACEAAPLIAAWQLKPLREGTLAERFQVFHKDGIAVAVSGIGKVRASIATSALLGGLYIPQGLSPVVANVGIAGTSITELALGSLVYINKVRDIATNSRLYPDVLLSHSLPEYALDTHDAPVTSPPTDPVVVDMEGSGFAQAALTFAPPSQICILKVISDYCSTGMITREQASAHIASQVEKIDSVLHNLRAELPATPQLTQHERRLLDTVCAHASFTVTQRIELTRRLHVLKANNIPYEPRLRAILATPITSKESRNRHYHALLTNLQAEVAL
jgi:adenosylhomocysteine nucleosidase